MEFFFQRSILFIVFLQIRLQRDQPAVIFRIADQKLFFHRVISAHLLLGIKLIVHHGKKRILLYGQFFRRLQFFRIACFFFLYEARPLFLHCGQLLLLFCLQPLLLSDFFFLRLSVLLILPDDLLVMGDHPLIGLYLMAKKKLFAVKLLFLRGKLLFFLFCLLNLCQQFFGLLLQSVIFFFNAFMLHPGLFQVLCHDLLPLSVLLQFFLRLFILMKKKMDIQLLLPVSQLQVFFCGLALFFQGTDSLLKLPQNVRHSLKILSFLFQRFLRDRTVLLILGNTGSFIKKLPAVLNLST